MPEPLQEAGAGALERQLREEFGFASFRPGQRELIEAILAGRDALGVLPTGGGKSLVYQLPATRAAGLTLVVSPLIALMKDQVDAFNRRGRGLAVALHSSLSREELRLATDRLDRGAAALVYVAPERLALAGLAERLLALGPRLLVVDEAHCVDQWGYDFRPSYLGLARVAAAVRPAPVLALTATATPATRRAIVERLALVDPLVKVAPFDRPNLRFEVAPCGAAEKERRLVALVRAHAGAGSVIVYVGRRRDADRLAGLLEEAGAPAVAYHAGLGAAARGAAQEAWLSGRKPVAVATVAFGMGIDKPDVRAVIHYQHPASLEAYYQEAGRAGRDGAAARCITLWSARDVALGQFFIRNRYPEPEQVAALLRAIPSENTPLATVRDLGGDLTDEQLNVALVALEEEQAIARDAEGSVRRLRTERGPRLWLRTLVARRRADYRRLDEVRAFLGEQSCVRARLLRHFGEELPDAHRCGNCSACSGRAAAPGRSERRKRVRGTASLWPAPEKAARRATPAAEPAPSGILWRSKQRAYAIEDLRARAVERRLGLAALALVAEAGEPLPPSGIANLLRGAARSSVAARQPRLVEIAGFGAGRGRRYADLLEDVLAMWAKGYLEAEPGAVPRLVLTPAGRAALDRARADR